MIEVIGDLIEESRRRAKSKYTPSRERARWIRLAGQLIWYKDQILRSMTNEALEEEIKQLEERVEQLRENIREAPQSELPAKGDRDNPAPGRKAEKRIPWHAQGRLNEHAPAIVPGRNWRVSLSR